MAVVCSLGLYTGGNHNRIRCDHMETPPAQVILSSRRSNSFRTGKFLLITRSIRPQPPAARADSQSKPPAARPLPNSAMTRSLGPTSAAAMRIRSDRAK